MNKLLLSSILFNFCALIGAIVMAAQNDFYTASGSYGYYWFLTILSLAVSIAGYHYHVRSTVKINHQYTIYITFGVYAFFTISWFGVSASLASISRECLYYKNELTGYYSYTGQRFSCDGEVISSIFGFLSFFVWAYASYHTGKKLYHHLNGTTGTTESPIPLEPVSTPPIFVIGDDEIDEALRSLPSKSTPTQTSESIQTETAQSTIDATVGDLTSVIVQSDF